ncbi:MAG: DUF1837 domain-containing protein [Bacteroidota bacterium]|nr:DUF1837 domain-containing protein [Bacteroidota bacterium]MDP3145983.1 DUF1837 domain-containing protein [Bacteroidota bacterium]
MAFESQHIITQHISQADLRTYFIGFDFGKYRNEAFTEILMDTIVDFAFGYHTGILKKYDRRKLKEAAKSIYNIKEFKDVKWTYVDNDSELSDCEIKAEEKYLKRGEFGELILHLLLRDFIETVPLLSKIHFKDTDGAVVHGFDLVHIGPDLSDSSKNSLYFGESKLYSRKDGKAGQHGIEDLIEDVKAHFKKDFLYREFALISKKKHSFIPIEELNDTENEEEYKDFLNKKKHWFNLFEQVEQEKMKLEDFLSSVSIPLVCTYQSKIFEAHNDEKSVEFIKEYEEEIKKLKDLFDSKLKLIKDEVGEPIKTNLNLILILLPIPSKKELVKTLHQKLFNQQNA